MPMPMPMPERISLVLDDEEPATVVIPPECTQQLAFLRPQTGAIQQMADQRQANLPGLPRGRTHGAQAPAPGSARARAASPLMRCQEAAGRHRRLMSIMHSYA